MGPTKVIINHRHLLHNFNLIKKAVRPSKVMGVVKANAYGHGSLACAQSLVEDGVDYLGVAFPEEGMDLRQLGLKLPILVFGAHLPRHLQDSLHYDLDLTLTTEEQLDALEDVCRNTQQKAYVHVKIDTGMGRVGFRYEVVNNILNRIYKSKCVDLRGVYTHFASADEDDLEYTRRQLSRLLTIRETVHSNLSDTVLFHAANSAAIMRIPEAHLDMVRPGVMLYGNPPSPGFPLQWDIKEVMSFQSKVGLIKELQPGEPVSYNRRFYTKVKTRIAVVPVGYADGFNRLFTNRGTVLIGGRRYPVIGAVCMDQIVINIGNDNNIQIGDDVVLYGKQGNEHIAIKEIAAELQTIPYEVTCWISSRVQRQHVGND
ncbi:MAG: alanine racemase [Caldithrix sp.]|nr:alanine racemase [Caldithrix sp.]